MKISTISQRLAYAMEIKNLKQIDVLRLAEPYCIAYNAKLGKSDLSQFINGKVEPGKTKLHILALALSVNEGWLKGYDMQMDVCTDSFDDLDLAVKNIYHNYQKGELISNHIFREFYKKCEIDERKQILLESYDKLNEDGQEYINEQMEFAINKVAYKKT